jgi:hypothetical protein
MIVSFSGPKNQIDFRKKPSPGLMSQILESFTGISPEKENAMDLKQLALALGLDPEKATAEQVLDAATKAGQNLSAALAKVKTFEGLSAVKPDELKAHGLELKDGKIVKLAAAPPADETPREKDLRERLEKSENASALSRLQNVKREIEEFSKAGQLPPVLIPAFTELASLQAEATTLCLSADGQGVQKKAVNVVGRVMEILKGLPKINAELLSQSAEQTDEQKKIEKAAKAKAAEVLARTTGGTQDED